ncbi:peptidoglycan DD-metalloendopeptidase family protein [Flavivirga amylovorans]|uniref:Peptidoglycan DD-metalloendopeptidase family protein n=1 Tax=Flavivirga amylovorans TaxID=870486 RepID=A0ABT8WXF2_9FLAO|nr:peptidoglycan DD-metalloendopeptidase family protein [Flavivirga amylovorans]MDO5986359.1 peptidoglycan DD-metalloendopeptidase family protein [Flavivirga amylovorans]
MYSNNFLDFLNSISSSPLRVLDRSIPNSKYIPLDLSESNKALNSVDVSSSSKLSVYINNHIKEHEALVAYGGYLEVRNIYKRSPHFNNQAKDGRNIHLGYDLWCYANTPIYTPLDATVHSFKNNTNYGDYGPTIILKHTIKDIAFYTLYGHLSLESIKSLKVDQVFRQGEQIATLGDSNVNGDYPPHLHFQIIRDLQNYAGDYPGVCSEKDLEFYIKNCPDPNILLMHI